MITLSLLFWILFVVSLVIFIYRNRTADILYILEYIILWIMLGILGYTVFDSVIK